MKSYRSIFGRVLSDTLKQHVSPGITEDIHETRGQLLRVSTARYKKGEHSFGPVIPLQISYSSLKLFNPNLQQPESTDCQWLYNVERSIVSNSDCVSCERGKNALHMAVPASIFTKHLFFDIVTSADLSDSCKDYMSMEKNEIAVTERTKSIQNIVVDFSSPNIAKQFHPGHLRSTILGNVLCNIYEYLGHTVTRLNYLGDWGTQFGYIGIGIEKYFSEEEFRKSPIRHYYDLYVKVNKAAQNENLEDVTQTSVHKEALAYFRKLEEGNEKEVEMWRRCRDASVEEYKHTYKKLGIKFDVYDGESLHYKHAKAIMRDLEAANILQTDSTTGVRFLEIIVDDKPHRINLIKSDGSTLYITRDLAAALDRIEKYNCDKLIYVVENGQTLHFQNLKMLLSHIYPDVFGDANGAPVKEVLHVKFGRVAGLKSRFGAAVLLDDVLDMVKQKMKTKMLSTETTKIPIEDTEMIDNVASSLAVSSIITQDLLELSGRNFEFSWDKILSPKGDALKLQYSHARLCSLIRKFSAAYEFQSIDDNEIFECIQHFSSERVYKKQLVSGGKVQRKAENLKSLFSDVTSVTATDNEYSLHNFESFCRKQMLILLKNCDFNLIEEPEALQLIQTMARFDEAIFQAYSTLQPYHIVNMLYQLSSHINKALYGLKVLEQPENIAQARMLLFHCSRHVLSEGMKLLGVTPLRKM